MKSKNRLNPKVSILMTSYNYEKYIAKAIESVLNQTFHDFELIIVDDASKDRSKKIIEEYAKKDERIRYIFHERNEGLSQSTNHGLSMCNGEYIAFIDSDDSWDKDKLRLQLDVFERESNVDVVYTDALIFDENGVLTGSRFSQKYHCPSKLSVIIKLLRELTSIRFPEVEGSRSGDIFESFLLHNWICKSSAIFRRNCIRNVAFRKELKMLNDWIFWMDLARKHEFYYISKPLTRYRVHKKSMTIVSVSSDWQKDHEFTQLIQRKYLYLLPIYSKLKFKIFFIICFLLFEKRLLSNPSSVE